MEVANVVDSAAAAVADSPVSAATTNPPATARAVDAVAPAAAAVDSVTDTATGAGQSGTAAGGILDSVHVASPTAETLRKNAVKTIDAVRRESAEAITPITDRLPAGPTLSQLEPGDVLGSIAKGATDAGLPATGPVQASTGEPPVAGPRGLLEPQAFPSGPLLSPASILASGGAVGKNLTLTGFGEVTGAGGRRASDRPGGGGGPWALVTDVGPEATLAGHSYSRSPAPLDAPLPSPESPKAVAPGLGDAFFVPLVALLALLALAAPAMQRRLREAPDFRAPTPFTCALERPG